MKLEFSVTGQGLDEAILELRRYIESIDDKCDDLRDKVADGIASSAQSGFNGATVDDTYVAVSPLNGKRDRIAPKPADVTVLVDHVDVNTTSVVANGEDAVFAEFGAGVYHNGALGSSPNPLIAQNGLPFVIGSHSEKGQAGRGTWVYVADDGRKVMTHGTPASMPMYTAEMSTIMDIPEMAKEVFSK